MVAAVAVALVFATPATACFTLVSAPTMSGPVVPYQSGTVITPEENRAEAERQSQNQDQMDADIDQAVAAEDVRQSQLAEQSTSQRAAADQNVQDFADSHPVDGFEPSQTSMSINTDTGEYDSIELQYVGPDGNVHHTVQFDGNGNPLGGVEQTPWGAASQNANAHAAPGTAQAWQFGQDFNGSNYPSEVRIADDHGTTRGNMKFNADGIAYWGEFFDENGVRNGGFYDPRLEPTYDDPDGNLAEVEYEKIATGACEECEDAQQARNDIATEINLVVRDMNDNARRHRRNNDYAREHQDWDQSLGPMRMRYDHLAGVRQQLQQKLEQATQALQKCCEEECEDGEEDDENYKIGNDYEPVPEKAFRIGQDSNTWCQHETGTPTTVPVTFGPTGPSVSDPTGPNGPATTAPPGGIYSAPEDSPYYNTSTPVGHTPYASDFPTIPSSCYESECPSGGLFPTLSILDELDTCYGSSCSPTTPGQTTVEQGDTPDATTTRPKQPSSTPEQPTYHSTTVKVKISVMIDTGAGQQVMAGQSLKLFASDFSLPPDCSLGCDESAKTDVASSLGPSQCITGSDGSCTIDVSACEFGSGADCGAGGSYALGANGFDPPRNETAPQPLTGMPDTTLPVHLVGTPVASSIAAVAGTPTGCSLGSDLCSAVTDQFAVGDFTHYVFGYPASDEQAFLASLGLNPDILYAEPNYCDEKMLPAPRQYSVPVITRSPAIDIAGRVGYAKITLTFDQARTGD